MNYLKSISELTPEEFKSIQSIVYETIGVNLTEAKNALVVSRLSKRLRELNFKSFGEYICYLEEEPDEVSRMFNYLTTNVTKFFREEHHFEYLKKEILPGYSLNGAARLSKKIRVWSAGCSTGEEPYTIAMVLAGYVRNKSNLDFEILASDVNTDVLDKAKGGIYNHKETEGIPYNLLKDYFKLGQGANNGLFKAKDSIRKKIEFRRANLNSAADYPFNEPVDIIFCRNVFIYFDAQTRDRILSNFYRCLKPGGVLFVGHSESVKPNSNNGNWRLVRHTIYERIPMEKEC